jgi:protein-S-isoprenylcysteine O-methyltransferase Ste14
MLGPLLFRLVITLAVAAIAGGTAVLRHPAFLTFLVLEAAWSLAEELLSRGRRPAAVTNASINPRQVPFVMSGKLYLLLRMVYHAILIASFARIGSKAASPTTPLALAGISLMVVGIVLRGWSMKTLGERFRSFEVRAETLGLETRGPYAIVRHPGYLALALFDLGMPLLLNRVGLLALVVVPLAVMFRRVSAEEDLLLGAYPAEYPGYVMRTRRIVPLIY